jgi:hypothetical protein
MNLPEPLSDNDCMENYATLMISITNRDHRLSLDGSTVGDRVALYTPHTLSFISFKIVAHERTIVILSLCIQGSSSRMYLIQGIFLASSVCCRILDSLWKHRV